MLSRTKVPTLGELLRQATLGSSSRDPAPAAMLVFAHPDDEVIGLGARLVRYQTETIVHVTDGAPHSAQELGSHGFSNREEYRACRESELNCALELAGLGGARRISFGMPDQEASFHLAELTEKLQRLLMALLPEVLFTHPYEGGHPDHDACTFAVHRTVARMKAAGQVAPLIIEAAFYHLGAQGMETGCFLPHADKTEEICWVLSPEERQRKEELLACFRSQRQMLRYFAPRAERFRIAPQYDFHRPPHSGPVFYDRYPWGMTSQRFCELARAADAVEEAAMAKCD
jgi:N-acetylglucosamine malate deacetylase 2